MNLGGRLNKVKQQADRLFLRGDKTDVIGVLKEAEELTEELRQLTEAFYKSEEKRLNTHHVIDEKKHRKIPENQAAEILKEALRDAPQSGEEKALYRTIIEEVAGVEQLLGKIVLDYEEQVEADVLAPLNKLLKEDFPSVAKQKKALKQAGVEVDASRARLRSSHSNLGQMNKVEIQKEELDDAESKLEQIRDAYAAELFSALSKQREIAQLSCLSLEMKLDFLQKSTTKLSKVLPPIRNKLLESSCSAAFGVSLHDHLRISRQEIADPIKFCIRRIIEAGIREEGIFRVTGSAGKIKRFKGAFDAGLVTSEMLSMGDYSREYDVHVLAGALKSYLRELPEPLLTHLHHDQLIEAIRKSDHKEKLCSLWQIVNSLPSQNYNNLRYVIKFLALLASFSSENKMTPNNIAIVIAPNLIWAQRVSEIDDIISIGRNMTLGNDYRTIVEQLIEYSDYFFKGDVDFGASPKKLEPPLSPKVESNKQDSQGNTNAASGSSKPGHRRTASEDFNVVAGSSDANLTGSVDCESPKQVHRLRKKPAPQPPQKGASLFSSGDDLSQAFTTNDSPEHSRSKSPPYSTLDNQTSTPFPAPRLHHTNSLRRPTAVPPKPPPTLATPAKPPRPNPPTFSTDSTSENRAPNSNLIGFEKVQKSLNESTEMNFIHEDNSLSHKLSAVSQSKDTPRPIGFIVDDPLFSIDKEPKLVKDNEIAQVKDAHAENNSEILRDKGLVPGSFRKSLEGVLKQQPQTLPRHMVKTETHAGEMRDHEKGFQLPAFPVPTHRATKEPSTSASEKPEPLPRSDKPMIPEKPSIANRSVIAVDHSRPIIPERPAAFTTRTSSISKKNEFNRLPHDAPLQMLPGADEPTKSTTDAKMPLNAHDGSKVALCVDDKVDGTVTQLIPLEPDKLPVKPSKPERPSVVGRLFDTHKNNESNNLEKSLNSEEEKKPLTKSPFETPSDSTNL